MRKRSSYLSSAIAESLPGTTVQKSQQSLFQPSTFSARADKQTRSLMLVDCPGFQNLLYVVEPHYRLPSKSTFLSQRIPKLFLIC